MRRVGDSAASFASLDSDTDDWQSPGTRWTCSICTYADNFSITDPCCGVCGEPQAEAPAVVVTWRCSVCTLDNEEAAPACAACAEEKPLAVLAANAPRSVWRCAACTLSNTAAAATCAACAAPAPFRRCPACSPRRACAAHLELRLRAEAAGADAREAARTAAWVAWEAQGCVPLARRDEDTEAASLTCTDGATARHVLASVRHSRGDAAPLSAEAARSAYGSDSRGWRDCVGEEEEGCPVCVFDTVWEEGREPRRRVLLLQQAGWRRVWRTAHGGVGSHPKWRRELPAGCGAQVLTMASTPSDVRSWDHTAAALARADREALQRLAS